jgi:hypothetical protein
MKFLSISKLLSAAAALGLTMAPASATTQRLGPDTTITRSADGVISWTGPGQFSAVEFYIGRGDRAGYVQRVNLGPARSVRIPAGVDTSKLGLNFVVAGGSDYLLLPCPNDGHDVHPTLVGLAVDCSAVDANGQPAGALVITS